jgi:2-haloacid dehalogenase
MLEDSRAGFPAFPSAWTVMTSGYYAVCMAMDSVRLITFDCYGTLINWESGILKAMRPMFGAGTDKARDFELLEMYGDVELELESGPYMPYRRVLADTVQEMGIRLDRKITQEDGDHFAQSLITWEPFADTVAALQRLATKFRLGIISNTDDELFAETKKKLAVTFDPIVTAQQVKSYKPSHRNFEEALRRAGLPKEQVLHAGQSVLHDVIPATEIGLRTVWVNRPSIRPGAGAAKAAVCVPTFEVSSVAGLADLLLADRPLGNQAAS